MATNDIYQGDGTNSIQAKDATININQNFDKSTNYNPSKQTNNLQLQNFITRQYTIWRQSIILKESLQQLYRKLALPKVAWLDRGFDLKMDKYFVNLQLNESDQEISIEDIFKRENWKKPLRILVEGQPGYGKSTLALKLAFDWANNKKYMHFKLVFFVSLRELGHRRFEDAIEEIGQRCYVNKNIIELINCYQTETLFILDGLDEMPAETREEVMKILHKQQFRKVTIVVFCRMGYFRLSKQERTRVFGLPHVEEDFCDKRINILGIKNEDKKIFLQGFHSQESVDKILKCVNVQLELFDSPLFLMLLPIMIKDDMQPFSTKTVLYKQLFNSIIKHTCINRGQSIEDDFDLFRVDSTKIHHIQQLVCNFGKLCVEKLDEGICIFESGDLTEEIYEMGFVAKQSQTTPFDTIIRYEAFHLSLIEFASAFCLWMEWKVTESAIPKSLLKPIVKRFFDSKGTSLTLPFLMGLMEDDLDDLLDQLMPFKTFFSLNFHSVADCFTECSPINISQSNRLKRFIPQVIKLYRKDFTYSNYEIVCNQLLKYDHVKYIVIDVEDLRLYSKILCQITARLVIRSEDRLNFILLCKIPFDIRELRYYQTFTIIESLLLLALSPHIEFCYLRVSTEELKNLSKIMYSNNVYLTIKFLRLKILARNECAIGQVNSLLMHNQIKNLVFYSENLEIDNLIREAARSTYLSRISIRGGGIDLFDLTRGEQKKYDYIKIRNNFNCRQTLSNKNCCHHLDISLSRGYLNAINEIEPSVLTCHSSEECNSLAVDYPTWGGLQSVNHLRVQWFDKPLFTSVWINLQILQVDLVKAGSETELVKTIRNSQITKLILKQDSDMRNVCACLNDLCNDGEKCNLKEIDFIHYSYFKLAELQILLKGLQLHKWDRVNLVSSYYCKNDDNEMCEQLSGFCVDHDLDFNNICRQTLSITRKE